MMARGMLMSAFVLVGVLNVIAEATGNADAVTLTKPLLMPLLLAWLVTLAGRRWPVPLRWLAAGIVFAWIGDLALMGEGDAAFMLRHRRVPRDAGPATSWPSSGSPDRAWSAHGRSRSSPTC